MSARIRKGLSLIALVASMAAILIPGAAFARAVPRVPSAFPRHRRAPVVIVVVPSYGFQPYYYSPYYYGYSPYYYGFRPYYFVYGPRPYYYDRDYRADYYNRYPYNYGDQYDPWGRARYNYVAPGQYRGRFGR